MLDSFRGVYKGKRVLVTGHTGFKGTWLSMFLRELGAEVLGFALEPPTHPNLFDAVGVEREIVHVIGDICDSERVSRVLHDLRPEFIFHLAAQSLVRLSYAEPVRTYAVNVLGTVNVLEATRGVDSVRCVVNVTSDKCYENREWPYAYREIDPMGGHDPYSSSKGCAELVTAAYRESYFSSDPSQACRVALASARAGNVIGGGDWAQDRLVPDCIRALSQKERITLRRPNAVRPWQFVLDALSGYLWLGARMYHSGGEFARAWNFGPSPADLLSVEQVTTLVLGCWGSGEYVSEPSDQLHEAMSLKLDCSCAHRILGWSPVYDVRKAVEQTVLWYKRYYENSSRDTMRSLCRDQIMEYVSCARQAKVAWSSS